MQNQVKLARAGLALMFVLIPGALAMQGCASQASSATAGATGTVISVGGAQEAADAPYVNSIPVIESDATEKSYAGYEAAVAVGSDEAIASYGTYRDGVYSASADGKCGAVPVTVTISGGKIVHIAIGDNAESPAMAQKAQDTVVPQIIAAQSTEGIDTATGATLTSEAIVEATAAALARAAW